MSKMKPIQAAREKLRKQLSTVLQKPANNASKETKDKKTNQSSKKKKSRR